MVDAHQLLQDRLGSPVLRVSLSGKDELHRPVLVVHQSQKPIEVRKDKVPAFILSNAAGKADRQRIRVEQPGGVRPFVDRILATDLLLEGATTDECDQKVLERDVLLPDLASSLVATLAHARSCVRSGQSCPISAS